MKGKGNDMQSKIKLLKVLDILSATDEKHPITASKICALLEGEGISAERKSICRDINTLISHGYSITLCRDNKLGYYMTQQKKERRTVTSETVKVTLSYVPERESELFAIFGKGENKTEGSENTAEFKCDKTALFSKLLGVGEFARIISPENVKEEFISSMEKAQSFYGKPRSDKKIEVWLL